jgi:hypothetical protein
VNLANKNTKVREEKSMVRAGIQAEGLAQCQAMFDFLAENAGRMEAGEAEREILNRLREIGRLGVEGFFAAKGAGDVGPWLEGDDGTLYERETRDHTRTYLSLFGKVKVRRVGYRHRGLPAVFPLDAEANLPRRGFSYVLQEFVNDCTRVGPFREAVRHMKKWVGQPVWEHSAETISRESSCDYDAYYDDRPAPDAAPDGDIIVASFDGKGVPMIKKEAAKLKAKPGKGEKRQKKKEALVGVCYTVDPKVREPDDIARALIYGGRDEEGADDTQKRAKTESPRARDVRRMASLVKPKEEVFDAISAEVEARDPHANNVLAILVDGDRGLERLAKTTFCKKRDGVFLILDILHAAGYLWDAAHAFHPEGSAAAKAFAYERLVQILKGRVGYVIGGLKSAKTKRGLRGAKAKTVDKCTGYFEKRKHMMAYDEYLNWGLPIATGVVESSCNSLVKNRMEGCGMRWSVEGAEAMLRLRSVYLSDDWQDYWCYHVEAEGRRLHGRVLRMVGRLRKTG